MGLCELQRASIKDNHGLCPLTSPTASEPIPDILRNKCNVQSFVSDLLYLHILAAGDHAAIIAR